MQSLQDCLLFRMMFIISQELCIAESPFYCAQYLPLNQDKLHFYPSTVYKGCFVFLGRSMLCVISIPGNTEAGLFQFPGGMGSRFTGAQLSSHPNAPTTGESITDAIADACQSQTYLFCALDKFYRPQQQKVLLHLGFSLQLKITVKKIHTYSF